MSSPSDPKGPTGRLCNWVYAATLSSVPKSVQERAKHLMLDGIGCALVGAHLPWSTVAVKAILDMEPKTGGDCTIFGWETSLSPLPAVLLNSAFIQGSELDDYHQEAPVHSSSILIPVLIAAAQHEAAGPTKRKISGADLLNALIVGYETGPRVGNALYGKEILERSRGWHSGSIFGPPAAAAAASKLLALQPNQIEDAIGIGMHADGRANVGAI